ncbi:hypothetical protein NQ317_013458 [Molorchus minor]|uniref:Uncharacterized protein n=1 Tax=Molorchus minor TaxID=1323400 RepID=A0ABQ9J753_9CUCU|nr:hypothetical protein NQ317_013458 [Molorchus minor]
MQRIDERPYLRGCLILDASSTIIGGKGWSLVKDLGLVLNNRFVKLRMVANGQQVESAGECEIPFCVREKVRNPGLTSQREWYFSNQPICLDVADHIRSKTVLTSMQEVRLQALIQRNQSLMGEELGCTSLTEHTIVTKSPPY